MLFNTYKYLCGKEAPRTKNEIVAAAQASHTVANSDFWDFVQSDWLIGDDADHPFGDDRDQEYQEILAVLEENAKHEENERKDEDEA